MTCYCSQNLEDLKREYGRMNRAHTTIMAALRAFKLFRPSCADQILFAAAVIGDCEARMKKLIEEKEHEDEDDISGHPA